VSKTATVLPATRVFRGDLSEVRHVRAFVAGLIEGCPAAADVVLLASEIAANAIVHTASGRDGTFSVVVKLEHGLVTVEVHDCGALTEPASAGHGAPRESGTGLALVETLADAWGFHGDEDGRVVWFAVEWH
jgi:anti-sigma regulatory factor (Ser/Thr protein kinase)